MPNHCYASFTGTRQGLIKGHAANLRRTGEWAEVVAFAMETETPLDQSAGQASGKRQHSALVITKQTNSASPPLFEATASGVSGPLQYRFPIAGSGGRKHGPITVTKQVDSASTNLFQACLGNEPFSEVIIEETSSDGLGVERIRRRVTLTDAVIVNVRHRVGMETATRRVVSEFAFMCYAVRDEAGPP